MRQGMAGGEVRYRRARQRQMESIDIAIQFYFKM
jgi:hypothetical protein